jgi:hypothetical protein
LSIQPLEAAYLIVILTTLFLTLSALVDARADSVAVKLLNGKARELAAAGNVRREVLRLLVLVLLLSIVLPELFDDDEVALSPFVLALMAIPIVLLISTIYDAKDRRAMTAVVAADLLNAGTSALQRIEEKLDANTEISQGAREDAHVAVEVANTVNEKIAHLNEALVSQGVDRAAQADLAARVEATVDTTASQVSDIHDVTVPGAGAA